MLSSVMAEDLRKHKNRVADWNLPAHACRLVFFAVLIIHDIFDYPRHFGVDRYPTPDPAPLFSDFKKKFL
jgi:hypothetical protein